MVACEAPCFDSEEEALQAEPSVHLQTSPETEPASPAAASTASQYGPSASSLCTADPVTTQTASRMLNSCR